MTGFLKRIKQSSPGRFYAKYSADRADEGAILIAWQALFSLFPLILGLLAIFALILRDPGLRQRLADAVQTQFPAQVADLLSFMDETRDLGSLLGIVSVLALLWSGSALFGAMAVVFNRFYDAPDRGFIWQRLMAFGMMAIYVVLILVSVLASGLSTFLVGLAEGVLPIQIPGVAFLIGWLVSLGSAVLMFLVLYRVVPNKPLAFADVWRGAVLAGLLFLILNQAFPIYLGFFGGGFAAYKALGLFLLLMTWFYFLARILVLGAELNAYLTGHGIRDDATAGSAPPAAARRRRRAITGHVAQRAGANGHAPAEAPGKTILWAGLAAGVTGLVLVAADRAAAAIWHAITHEDPPGRIKTEPAIKDWVR